MKSIVGGIGKIKKDFIDLPFFLSCTQVYMYIHFSFDGIMINNSENSRSVVVFVAYE
jgi:hypothetical protein